MREYKKRKKTISQLKKYLLLAKLAKTNRPTSESPIDTKYAQVIAAPTVNKAKTIKFTGLALVWFLKRRTIVAVPIAVPKATYNIIGFF